MFTKILIAMTIAVYVATANAQGPMASKGDIAKVEKSLAEGRVTVLQITSRDPACGCRVEEERAFDKLVGTYGPDVVFRRVEWSSCLTGAGPVCRSGTPVIHVYYGKGDIGQVTDGAASKRSASLNSLESVIERGKTGPPALFGYAPRLIDDLGNPPMPQPSLDEVRALGLRATRGFLSFAASACGNFNREMSKSLLKKLDAWQRRHKPISDDQEQAIAARVGRDAMRIIRHQADDALVKRVSINKASKAGCTEFSKLLDKL